MLRKGTETFGPGLAENAAIQPGVRVVEDEQSLADLMDLMQSHLEAESYTVVATGDGLSARRLVQEQRPDLVIDANPVLPRMAALCGEI